MQGIFLHILADALGSVAVIISTLLTKYYGWSGWDPIASCIIAILIFASAIPLVKSSGMRLMLSLPADAEYGIRNTLQELSSLRGVVGYTVPKALHTRKCMLKSRRAADTTTRMLDTTTNMSTQATIMPTTMTMGTLITTIRTTIRTIMDTRITITVTTIALTTTMITTTATTMTTITLLGPGS
jgi:hypothetical protein